MSPHLFFTFQGFDLLKLISVCTCVKKWSTYTDKLDHAMTKCVAHMNITDRKRIVNLVMIASVACHFPWRVLKSHRYERLLEQEQEFGLSPLKAEVSSALHLFQRRSKKVKTQGSEHQEQMHGIKTQIVNTNNLLCVHTLLHIWQLSYYHVINYNRCCHTVSNIPNTNTQT